MLAVPIIDVGKVNVRTVPISISPLLGSTRTPPVLGFSVAVERAIHARNQHKIMRAHFILGAWAAASCVEHQVRHRRSGRFAFHTFLVRGALRLIRGWPVIGFDIGWQLENLPVALPTVLDNTSSRRRPD